MSQTLHAVPAAIITHTTAVICGDIVSDIAVSHARTTDARLGLTLGTVLMNLYSAGAAQGLLAGFAAAHAAMAGIPRDIPIPPTPPYEPFARTTLAIDWTRRPAYCVVPRSEVNKTSTATIHWLDLYCGPITFQIRDQRGLKSTLALLTHAHRTAAAIFLDGAEFGADPTSDDYREPR